MKSSEKNLIHIEGSHILTIKYHILREKSLASFSVFGFCL